MLSDTYAKFVRKCLSAICAGIHPRCRGSAAHFDKAVAREMLQNLPNVVRSAPALKVRIKHLSATRYCGVQLLRLRINLDLLCFFLVRAVCRSCVARFRGPL